MKASKTTNVAMAIAAASLFAFAPMSAVHAGDEDFGWDQRDFNNSL